MAAVRLPAELTMAVHFLAPAFIVFGAYLDGVLYPGEYLLLSRVLAAAVVVGVGAIVLWPRRRVAA